MMQNQRWKEQNRVFQSEGTYDYHPLQLSDHIRAEQKLQHVLKGIVQMPLPTLTGAGHHSLLYGACSSFDHPLGK